MEILHWEKAKSSDPGKNEDRFNVGNDVVAISDGATDKTGFTYPSGYTGGRELADIAVNVAVESSNMGYELTDDVTQEVRYFYSIHHPEALDDPSHRAAATLVVARVALDQLIITQVGDTNFRITLTGGQRMVFTNDKKIDQDNARLRTEKIITDLTRYNEEFGVSAEGEDLEAIIASGRDNILDRLRNQWKLQNSDTDEEFGYGTIDGSKVPSHFISGKPTGYVKNHMFKADEIQTVELVTDGFYGQFPTEPTPEAYADLHTDIHESDPHKFLKYPSTKPMDDALALIVHL